MEIKELIEYIRSSNKTTEMDCMKFMNGVDELCDFTESMLSNVDTETNENFEEPEWSKEASKEFGREYCKMVDDLFIENLKDIHNK